MTYHLFISHSWTYSDAYKKLVSLLDSNTSFKYRNYSVPKDDPVHNANSQAQLRAAIRNQMQHASCVLILAGVYSTYSKWINIEIELAKKYNKPIIAVEPWGAQRTSAVVSNAATVRVGWNAKSVANAVRNHAIYQNQ